MFIYSIKDVKSGFKSPILRANDSLAIRDFKMILSNDSPDNPLIKFPEDYELWCLGEFNEDSGIITSNVRYVFSAIGGDSDAK